ncbi:glycosyltransferase, partial [Burkholderia multivorans]|uniref:glycosyltransferase n=1 Tax=Burkholderia multivorans TaxID=87883 RepID=UPI001C23B63D
DSTRFSASMIWLSVNLDFFILQNSLNEKILLLITPVLRGDYPSIVEGYGLPIMESLWMGKPCLCHSEGVMAELAEKGGCMTVNMLDEHALATAMEQLAEQSELRRRLSLDALDREIFDWADYGSAIEARIAECVG